MYKTYHDITVRFELTGSLPLQLRLFMFQNYLRSHIAFCPEGFGQFFGIPRDSRRAATGTWRDKVWFISSVFVGFRVRDELFRLRFLFRVCLSSLGGGILALR